MYFVTSEGTLIIEIDLKVNKFVTIWQDRIAQIERGKVVMSDAYIPEPYFGKSMDKTRQLAFCKRMIAQLEN